MRVLILTMFAHLSPGRAPKSLAWALGDTLDDSPSEDPVVGAVVLDQRVDGDGVDIITVPTAAEAIIMQDCGKASFLAQIRARGQHRRFIAAHVLDAEDCRLKDCASKKKKLKTKRRDGDS